jgi:hypothetical protein
MIKRIYGNKKGMGIPALETPDKELCTSLEKAVAFTDFFKDQQTLQEPPGHQLPPLILLTDQRLAEVSTTTAEIKMIIGTLAEKGTWGRRSLGEITQRNSGVDKFTTMPIDQ